MLSSALLRLAAFCLVVLPLGSCAAVVQIAVQAAMETTLKTAHYAIVAGSREDKVRGYASVGFTAARPDATRPPEAAVDWLRANREAFREELGAYNKAHDLARGPGDNTGERVADVQTVEWIQISDARLDQLSAVIEFRVGQRDFVTATRTFVLQWQGERLAIIDHFDGDDVTLAAYLGLPPSPPEPVAVAKAGPDSPGAIAAAPTPSALATQPSSTSSAGTTTSSGPASAPANDADLAAAQGAFDAWLVSNRATLEREIMAYLRETDLHTVGNGAQRMAGLSATRVTARTETGYIVVISYTLRRSDGWGETYSHTDSFKLEIVNDALTSIELAAATTAAAAPAAASAEAEAAPDLGAAQASFETWLAANQEDFKTELTRYGRARDIDGLSSSAGMRHVSTLTNIKVLEQRGEAYVVEMNYDTEGAQAYTAQATRGVVKVLVTLADGRLVGIDPA